MAEMRRVEFGYGSVARQIMIHIDYSNAEWYKRLWAVICLPYQLARFICIGQADFLEVCNVRSKW